jgi:hypothetical protein
MGRPLGSSFDRQDAPRIEEMGRLIDGGKASSPTAAAEAVIPHNHRHIKGWGSREAKIRRHVIGYRVRYG